MTPIENNNEEDRQLRDLFAAFNPPLDDEKSFVDRLEARLDAIEAMKCELADIRRRTRHAVIAALIAGVAVGVSLTKLFPMIGSQTAFSGSGTVADYVNMAMANELMWWIAVAIIATVAAVNVYQLAMVRLHR